MASEQEEDYNIQVGVLTSAENSFDFKNFSVISSGEEIMTSSSAEIMAEETTEDTAASQLDAEFAAKMEAVVSVVAPLCLAIVILIGFFGNLLVVLVVSFNKQMRNTTNLLILNLAVADILFIVFCVPFSATGYALPHNYPFGDVWCKLVQFLIIATAYVSIYTLVFMSLDRFLAVVYPIESMTLRSEANCRLAIAVTWFVPVVLCLPVFFAHGEVPYGDNSYCIFMDNQLVSFLPESWDFKWNLFAFQISFFITAYVMPLLIICVLYSIMLHRLWKTGPVGRASAESIKNKKRVIKMVLVVVVIFALSWLPIHVILVMRAMKKYNNNPATVTIQIISHILAYSNSCVNPILYAFLSEPFRRGFWAVITCIRPSGPHGMGGANPNGIELKQRKPPQNNGNPTKMNNGGKNLNTPSGRNTPNNNIVALTPQVLPQQTSLAPPSANITPDRPTSELAFNREELSSRPGMKDQESRPLISQQERPGTASPPGFVEERPVTSEVSPRPVETVSSQVSARPVTTSPLVENGIEPVCRHNGKETVQNGIANGAPLKPVHGAPSKPVQETPSKQVQEAASKLAQDAPSKPVQTFLTGKALQEHIQSDTAANRAVIV